MVCKFFIGLYKCKIKFESGTVVQVLERNIMQVKILERQYCIF
jgi:hypothetical protein